MRGHGTRVAPVAIEGQALIVELFKDGKRTQPALVTIYFNGIKVHGNQPINQVWGGANSGLDGGNDGGKGITDTPGGLKLQCEGHDVRYRNVWIKELDLAGPNTNFKD